MQGEALVGFGGEPEGQAEQEGTRQEQGEVQQEEQEAGAGVGSGRRHFVVLTDNCHFQWNFKSPLLRSTIMQLYLLTGVVFGLGYISHQEAGLFYSHFTSVSNSLWICSLRGG